MKRLSIITTLVAAFCAVTAWAQGPNNTGTYYQSANGQKGKGLKTALAGIISPHTNIGYKGLWEAYKKTDTRADGYVRDWYSNTTKYVHITDKAGSYKKEGDVYNREHTVPQSWFSEANPMVADIVHVVPTDGYVNNMRSNYPFGEVGNASYTSNNGYSKLGSCKTAGYSGTVFEPNDEIKGDMARIYFYMVTRYQDQCGSWGNDVFTTTYPGLTQWTLDMMMRWSKQDPVDDVERARNNAVYEVQGNRNPFVDYPGLEDYVWGTKTGVAFSYDNYDGSGTDPQPATVAQPVFSPLGGTYTGMVNVSMMTTTQGATIFFTANGSEPTDQSTRYTGPIIIDETTTLKAVAIKDDTKSSITEATYVITTQDDDDPEQPEQPADCTISLNNTFFGVSWSGTRPNNAETTISGTENGITITYSLGSSANMFCNNEHIRMYGGNELKVESSSSEMVKLEFVTIDSSKKLLLVNGGGSVEGYTWTGKTNSVTFSSESNHIKMSSVKVSLAANEVTGIQDIKQSTVNSQLIYDLQGRRVMNPQKGLYIVNGHKVSIR